MSATYIVSQLKKRRKKKMDINRHAIQVGR